MSELYKLDAAGEPVACPNVIEWARWFQVAERHVADAFLQSERYGMVRVSTVFLGIDHAFGGGPPVLWETMVFREKGTDSWGLPPPDDLTARGFWGEMRRYASRADAEAGHAEILAAITSAGWTPTEERT